MASLVFRSAEAKPRLDIAGGRVEIRNGFAEVIPDLSRADFQRIQFGSMPHQELLESMVTDLYPAGSKQAKQFFDTRKIVRRDLADGRAVVSVTSNVWDKTAKPAYVWPEIGERRVAGKGQKRVYELAQILTDTYLLDKFLFTPKQINTARTMAVANAGAAAAYLQTTIRETPEFAKYEVTAGKYAKSKKWAKDSLATAAVNVAALPVHIDSAIVGEKLFMYGPSDSAQPWSVFGPMWYAAELKSLYSVVMHAGPAQASFALGMETTLLDLDVMCQGVVMCPAVQLHVGPQQALPVASSVVTQELLSSGGRARISELGASIEPVFVDGEQVACAVRISKSRVLVNGHVVQSGEDVRAGSSELYPQKLVSKDLWVARCHKEQHQIDWILREPVVGEQVVVCYLRGTTVQYTSPVTVRASDGVTIVTSLTSDLKAGMSGGAILALHDMALLGVYSGVGSQQAVGAVFSQSHYTDLCTSDAVSELGRIGSDEGSDVYAKMRARGLGRLVDAAIGSLEPVYDGLVHVGMGYQYGSEFRTTCDADSMPLTVGAQKRNVVFCTRGVGEYYARDEVSLSGGPFIVRNVQHGERVFVLGRDSDGPYASPVSAVRHIGVAARSFYVTQVGELGDLPLRGGLIMAVSDGAVVGQFGAIMSNLTLGEIIKCVSIEPAESSPRIGTAESVVEWLARTFPMLNPGLWPVELIEEVFTHSSVGHYSDVNRKFNVGASPLAFIGDAVGKLLIGKALRAAGVPHSTWQVAIQGHQTDRVMAASCEDLGLDRWIKVGKGVNLTKGSKAHATLLEALLGAAYEQETYAAVEQFAVVAGIISHSYAISDSPVVAVAMPVGGSKIEDAVVGT